MFNAMFNLAITLIHTVDFDDPTDTCFFVQIVQKGSQPVICGGNDASLSSCPSTCSESGNSYFPCIRVRCSVTGGWTYLPIIGTIFFAGSDQSGFKVDERLDEILDRWSNGQMARYEPRVLGNRPTMVCFIASLFKRFAFYDFDDVRLQVDVVLRAYDFYMRAYYNDGAGTAPRYRDPRAKTLHDNAASTPTLAVLNRAIACWGGHDGDAPMASDQILHY